MKGWYTIAVFFLAFALQAQEPAFYASVNKNVMRPGETLRLEVVIENAPMKDYTPPAFKDFTVLNQSRGTSTQVTIVNGKQEIVQRLTLSYLLRPKRKGTLTIEPATLQTNQGSRTTEAITITVQEGAAQQERQQQSNLFVKAYVDDASVFVGEQILLSYKIYTRHNIASYEMPNLSLNGFWKMDVPIRQPKVKREIINGIPYRTAVIEQKVLFPQQAGKLTIPAGEVAVDIEYGFFSTRRLRVSTNPITIEVQSLPANAPPSFIGAVGRLSLESTISADSVAVDEAITLRLKFSGQTNFNLLNAPAPQLPADFEVYDPKVTTDASITGGRYVGKKTFEYLIIPRRPGTYTLDSMKFSYFHPPSESYTTLSAGPYTLTISGTSEAQEGSPTPYNPSEVTALENDIRFIKTGQPPHWQPAGYHFLRQPLFHVLYWGPLVGLIVLGTWLFFFRKKGENEQMRQNRALKAARKDLKAADKALQQNDDNLFYQHLQHAVWSYLQTHFALPPQEATKAQLENALGERQIPEPLIEQLHQTLEKCEMALYAPAAATVEKQQFRAEVAQLLMKIHKHLKA